MGSKSTSDLDFKKSREAKSKINFGYQYECWVCQYLLAQHKNWRLLAQNKRISGVEVDLIFEEESKMQFRNLHLVEVKSLMAGQYFETRVRAKQKERIRKVLRIFIEKGFRTRAHLALVSKSKQTCLDAKNFKIQIIQDYFIEFT